MTHRHYNARRSNSQTRQITFDPTRMTPKETLLTLAGAFGGRGELRLKQEPTQPEPKQPEQKRSRN